MECFEIKSEEGGVLLVEYAPTAEQNAESMMSVEDSEDLFCKPHYQKSLDTSLNESKYRSSNTSTADFPQDDREKAVWLDKHCRLLIAIYKEEYPKLGKTFELKTKQKLWKRIADRMREHGSYFTASQVQGKWKTFERSFNKKLATDKPCPYRKDLAPFFLKHKSKKLKLHLRSRETEEESAAAIPVLEVSTSEAQSPKTSTKSDISLSDDESLSDSSMEESPIEQKKFSNIVEELQQWREEFNKERKSKRKYWRAKLRAYKRRTVALEKQNRIKQRLLEALIASNIGK